MITRELRQAWRFFMQHAGYVVGRAAQGALALAKAEAQAEGFGLTFAWEPDWHCCLGDVWDGIGPEPETIEVCVCYGPDQTALASLGGITDATDDYRRVVEAELAAEALYGARLDVYPDTRHGQRREVGRAGAWLDDVPCQARSELAGLILGGAGDGVIADWIEDHGGQRGWADILSVCLERSCCAA